MKRAIIATISLLLLIIAAFIGYMYLVQDVNDCYDYGGNWNGQTGKCEGLPPDMLKKIEN